MNERVTYDDEIDLLGAEHQAVRVMLMRQNALCGDHGCAEEEHRLATSIGQAKGAA